MIEFTELADAIARKLVENMSNFELEDYVRADYTEYYAMDVPEVEVIDVARQLGIDVEDYIIGG